MEKPTFEELSDRIADHMADDGFDNLDAACWHGYLSALTEWQLISVEDHRKLVELLPSLDPNPVIKIMLGYSRQREQAKPSKNSQN